MSSTSGREIASSINTKQPAVEQMNIDGVVNPSMLHAHLALLTRFRALELPDSKADERYIIRAQERYILWLELLKNERFAKDDFPIPPIDVCYIWHAHTLSPLRYYEDMKRLYDPRGFEYNFPLEKLHEIWKRNGGHTDFYSEQIWLECTKKPWVLDPNDESDFDMTCPFCNNGYKIRWLDYVNMYRTPEYEHCCPFSSCSVKLSSEILSAKRFLDDIVKYRDGKTVHIGGTLVDLRNGSYSVPLAETDCDLLFPTTSIHITTLVVGSRTSHIVCRWSEIVEGIKKQMDDLKKNCELRGVRRGIMRRMVLAYTGNPAPFSLDLVSAVIRQREFTHKMVNNEQINCQAVQARATIRYHKFLLLQKERQKYPLVPTLDIDLGWHTHMLHPSLYRNYTREHLSRIINHDDTLPQKTLSNGFAYTSRAWYKKYHEPYTHEDPSEYWLTNRRKVMAAVLPPYALWVLFKLSKYRKGTCKTNHYNEEEVKDIREEGSETTIGSKKDKRTWYNQWMDKSESKSEMGNEGGVRDIEEGSEVVIESKKNKRTFLYDRWMDGRKSKSENGVVRDYGYSTCGISGNYIDSTLCGISGCGGCSSGSCSGGGCGSSCGGGGCGSSCGGCGGSND